MKDISNLAAKPGQHILEVSWSVKDKKEEEEEVRKKKEAGRYN